MINFQIVKYYFKDKIILFFFINAISVVFSYYLYNKLNFIYPAFYAFKSGFIILSLLMILNKTKGLNFFNGKILIYLIFYIFTLFLSQNISSSFSRAIPYLIALVYTYYFIKYLINLYTAKEQLFIISIIILFVY